MEKARPDTKRKTRESHGMYDTPEYRIWRGIRERAYRGTGTVGDHYFHRGILMCREWAASFMAFYDHIGPRPSKGHSVDRIDTLKGYEPGNVRWATRIEQMRNKIDNRLLTIQGETKCVAEWSTISGVSESAIGQRLDKLGWDSERAVFAPVAYSCKVLSDEEMRLRRKATCAVTFAVRTGKLVRPRSCPVCGRDDRRIEVNHDEWDGTRDNIKWFCSACRGASFKSKRHDIADSKAV